jgi:RimJ/RimL family protein N-acetyltransferase
VPEIFATQSIEAMSPNCMLLDHKDVLLTERLRLRQFRLADTEQIEKLAGDRDVALMTGNIPHPYPAGTAKSWIERTAGHVEQGLLRQHAVTAGSENLVIGAVSLRKASPTDKTAELAYWLGKPYWGCGYIPEAAAAALQDAAETFDLSAAWAGVLPENPRSIRVLEKLGFAARGAYRVSRPDRGEHIELTRFELELPLQG